MATTLNVETAGDQLVEALQSRLGAISIRALTSPRRPTVACLEWIEPLMAAGNWVPELVEMAGAGTLFGCWKALHVANLERALWARPRLSSGDALWLRSGANREGDVLASRATGVDRFAVSRRVRYSLPTGTNTSTVQDPELWKPYRFLLRSFTQSAFCQSSKERDG